VVELNAVFRREIPQFFFYLCAADFLRL